MLQVCLFKEAIESMSSLIIFIITWVYNRWTHCELSELYMRFVKFFTTNYMKISICYAMIPTKVEGYHAIAVR